MLRISWTGHMANEKVLSSLETTENLLRNMHIGYQILIKETFAKIAKLND